MFGTHEALKRKGTLYAASPLCLELGVPTIVFLLAKAIMILNKLKL